MRTYSWTLKITAYATLALYLWCFGPLFQLPTAFAAEKKQGQGASSKGQGSKNQTTAEPRTQTAGERFEKTIQAIHEHINKVEEKSRKGQEPADEINAIKSCKAEIESIDAELKTEFAATEKKLKDAKLPQEILSRHANFVEHYQYNLKQLIANLEKIEKAQTKAEVDATISKTKEHLDRVKKPSTHKKIDPNKLSHRLVKAKERAPRLKQEQFERDFPQHKTRSKQKIAASRLLPDLLTSRMQHKPVLLAFNETASDIPLSLGAQSSPLQFAYSDSSPFLLAQATNQPSADDLAETPDIQFTDAIRAKAQELGNNPVKIYNWVRNNIDYQPYYGSFKGAAQTLAEGAGNDFDQASLLIALLRVSNIAAKYSYGTVEISANKAANMVGVSDPRAAATLLSTQGIPVKLMIAGGTVKAIQMERAWVEAFIDYFPSWGARHKQGGEDTWIQLDPAFKQYTYKQGMDMYAEMGFNTEEFLMSYITDTRGITAYQDYSMRMISFLDINYPDASVEDVLGASEIKQTKNIVKQEFPYLMGTLPYKVIINATQFTGVPQSKDYSITIQIEGDSLDGTTGLAYIGGLNELASKRVTVSYDPATSSDEALISQYGGNVFSVPPYLLNVKPVLRINGAAAATGSPIGMGKDQSIVISLAGPDGDTDRIQNIITAGAYSAIILQAQNTPVDTPSKNMAKLIENSKKADSPDITLDDLLGQLLYSIGVSYFETLSYENEVFAKTLQLVALRQPSEAMVTQDVKVDYLFGLPRTISAGGVNVDVDRNVNIVYSPTQDKEREKAFMILSGLESSVSENRILEAFFNVPSVSSVRLLKQASEQSIPIYTITGTNLNEVLPQLQVDADVKTDIVNAVNAGKNVIVSKTNITYGRWVGVGYIIRDPATGSGSYMISGGLAGADTDQTPIADPNFKVTWLDRLIFKIVRSNIISYAEDLIGTLYKMGCKDPSVTGACSGRIDCSGLTSRCYAKAGIKLLGDGSDDFPYKNAQQQYDYSLQIDDPIYADLVFFKGSYDKNCDGIVDTDDNVTHVAIYRSPNTMIGAQRNGVTWFEISSWAQRYPLVCNEFVCKQKVNNVCVAWDTCNCVKGQWKSDSTRPKFDPFVGYGKIIP